MKIMEQFYEFWYLISEERKNSKFEEFGLRVKIKNGVWEEDFLNLLTAKKMIKLIVENKKAFL